MVLAGAQVLWAQEESPVRATEASGTIGLARVAAELDLLLEWDVYRNVGALRRGDRVLSFRLDEDLFVDPAGNALVAEPIRRSSEGLVMPPATAAALRRHFDDDINPASRIQAIFIDPGHGGRDPGAIGRHEDGSLQVMEKDVVLAVGLELARLLRETFPNKEVALSRDQDIFLSLEERTEIANDLKNRTTGNIVYVSIHANAAFTNSARGFEVWILPPDVNRSVLEQSEIEEAEESVLPILNIMREEEYLIDSELLGRSILGEMDALMGASSPNRGVRYESWAVVRDARMAAVLVEVGFVTNPDEAQLLSDETYLARVGRAIYNGVLRHIERYEGASAIPAAAGL